MPMLATTNVVKGKPGLGEIDEYKLYSLLL